MQKHSPIVGAFFPGYDTLPLLKKSKKCVSDNNILVLDCPSNSPDINPVANLCAIIKRQLLEHCFTAIAKPTTSIIAICCSNVDIIKNCENLIASMPNQVNRVIKNMRGHIGY